MIISCFFSGKAYEKLWVQILPSLVLGLFFECQPSIPSLNKFSLIHVISFCSVHVRTYLLSEVSLELGKTEQIVTEVAVVLQK